MYHLRVLLDTTEVLLSIYELHRREHLFVEKLLRFSVCLRLHLPIKGCNLCISPSLPARAADCFKGALGFYRITISNNEGTGPIDHHPDLPQLRLGMLHDPPGHFADAAWSLSVRTGEWLEICVVVRLCFWAFL